MAAAAGHRRLEHRWLCRLARQSVPASTLADLAGATAVLDWGVVLETAETHGVSELLHSPLTTARACVPAGILDRLESRVLSVTASNLALTTQLARVMQRFCAHGIRALAFKGPALAAAAYGHLGRRSSMDLDVLVDRRNAARVRPLLLAEGYTLPPRRRHRGGSLLYGLYPEAGRDDTLLPPRADLAAVDVHIGFAFWTQGIRLDSGALFDRAVMVDVAGVPIPTLCHADLLLVLAIHGMMHGWCALRLVADIDAVAAHIDDWDTLVRRARSARMLRVLWVALLLAHGLLGTKVPPHVLALATSDRTAVDVAGGVPARLFPPTAAAAGEWDPRPWFLSFQDRPIDRLRFHARDLLYEWFLKWPWDDWLGRRRGPRTVS